MVTIAFRLLSRFRPAIMSGAQSAAKYGHNRLSAVESISTINGALDEYDHQMSHNRLSAVESISTQELRLL